ncbi:TnsD family transposase [Vibrio sp. HS-50-1]|uniref:TnsD family Tn7-like transposition protein n=1 Tax=Vibrio sp. HS-50-1 TaxID=2945079 RepID=UPI00215F214E|nr:TnsD family Tn7-like transposition protein [Vibrio sp. HS-50-1]MCS0206111.1 TnsD family transposase [Vibrio sp. HS-50-1]
MQLPKVLPDESLFSRICRHLATCGVSPTQVLKRLVGDGRAVIHPYLTSNLHLICKFTDETASQLLSQQTLRPIFSHYLPKYRSVINDVTAASNDIVRACQLSTFRDCERLSVKYCPQCAKEDMQNFGVAYWHLLHQVPGLNICSRHTIWLVHVEFTSRNHAGGHLLPDSRWQSRSCGYLTKEFSEFVEHKVKRLQFEVSNLESFSDSYLRKLLLTGGLTQKGRIKRKKMARELFYLSKELSSTNAELLPRSVDDYRYFSSLFTGLNSQHPFKHLLLEFYLSRCQSSNTKNFVHDEEDLGKEKQCCDLLILGLSMAAVSRKIDKSRCYVKGIALKNDIPVNLKPKTITRKLRESVVELAKKGFHRNVVAKRYGISAGSVELIISTTKGLVERRKQCKAESLRRRHRCKILRFVDSHPNANRQTIKKANEAAFYWLYNHEVHWLESVLPAASQTLHVEKIDWNQRDNEVIAIVRNLLFSSSIKLSRTEMDRIMGSHGWLTSRIEKLPKTREFLRERGLL